MNNKTSQTCFYKKSFKANGILSSTGEPTNHTQKHSHAHNHEGSNR